MIDIALFCVLIVLGLGHCDELPSRYEVESSINRTVSEVERLIQQDPSLPRLNRHEIVDILFNITSKDIEIHKSKETVEEARKIYQKALMVVLPYNAQDAKENIKELYTRPPIVKLVADPSFSSQDLEKWKNEILLQPSPSTITTTTTTRSTSTFPSTSTFSSTSTSTFPSTSTSTSTTQETLRDKEPLENLVVTHAAEKSTPKESSHTKTRYKNHKDTYSEVQTKLPLKETLKYDSAPIRFSFNLENLQKQSIATEKLATTTKRPVFQTPPASKNEDVYLVYSTSATTERTTAETPFRGVSKEFDLTTSSPHSHQQNILSFDQWHYNAPPSTTQRIATTSRAAIERIREKPFLPTIKVSEEDTVTTTTTSKTEDVPSRISFNMAQAADTERSTTSIYVTPVSSSVSSSYPSTSETSKYTSTYNINSGGFRRITTTTMRPQVMDLLASIGLRPENTMNVEEVFAKNQKNLGTKFQIPGTNGFLHTMTSGLTAGVPDSPSIAAQNTFSENPVSEIGLGMNNLTPDVQVLFQRFGLHTSNPATTTTTTTPKPTVNTNSYTNFKPLPTSNIKDEEMKEFLARFGLGVSESRQRKAMPASTERPSLIEAVPNNMRSILENIGLISRRTPKTTTPRMETLEPPRTTQYDHVFKPHEVRLKDEGQKMKINEFLDTVRLVQEGKASVKDVRKVANDLIASTKSLKDGPDPLSLEELVKIYNEDVKNEVKRQQSPEEPSDNDQERAKTSTTTSATTESIDVPSTTTPTTTTTTPTTTTSTTVTPDSAKDASDLETFTPSPESTSASVNLAALEESFGGTTRAPDPVLPTKPRSGLYFLVDWNSFLEVGEDNSEKVDLKFQPKAGDRSRFLPVTVP
ncbi:mucin-5AC isoform X2 [Odontomachus brunneus]|uniref:mucin-5AC isoform X2 n=1 Tax=Odontomachus brunneus TaxID=486640 RepID=UPI0013F24104|nr:mucin-5AC isoform X2 [Odontomachus brunneus]